MYINKIFLFGNLTRDPELRSLPSGIQVASFGLATNRRFKRNEKWEEATEFHNIVVFGRQADTVSQYLKKGSSAFIEGRIQTRSWEGDKGKQYRTEIIAERIQFGPRAGGESPSEEKASKKAPPKEEEGIAYPEEDINPDDIPF
ncbi:MAG: single-stranded DNA-binding protein [Patescibacteria group bacterium]|nr:single-stranded DNA-binding protein [Patescibacteria group bacterium]